MRLAFYVALLATLLFATATHAFTIVLGKTKMMSAPICLKKEDAIKIVKADVEEGIEVASKIYAASAECDRIEFYGTPKKVVYRGKTARGTNVAVIETEVEGQSGTMTVWMLAEAEIETMGTET